MNSAHSRAVRASIIAVLSCAFLFTHATNSSAAINIPNSAIADQAEKYANGATYNECLIFVTDMIARAGGPKWYFGFNTATYQSQWATRADPVGAVADARRGDIVQWGGGFGSSAYLHTAIITQPGSNPSLIDSNFAGPHKIGRGTLSSRTPAGSAYRIWRVGRVGSDPVGHYDTVSSPTAGTVRVTGWTFDPDVPTSAIAAHVYIGGPAGSGAEGKALTANAFRPDVGAAFPGVGNHHGVDATFETGRTGNQQVCMYGINANGGNNPLIGCKTVHIADAQPFGSFDELRSPVGGKISVRGWAYDRNAGVAPISVHVYVGGPAGSSAAEGHDIGLANKHRPDVDIVFPGFGAHHGFDSVIETKKRGLTEVCAYVINVGPGANQRLRCARVTIGEPPPPSAVSPSTTDSTACQSAKRNLERAKASVSRARKRLKKSRTAKARRSAKKALNRAVKNRRSTARVKARVCSGG